MNQDFFFLISGPALDSGDFSIISSTLRLDAGENIVNGTKTFIFAQTVDDLMIENNFTLTISFNSSNFPASNVVLDATTQDMVLVLDDGKSQLSRFRVNNQLVYQMLEMACQTKKYMYNY